MPQTVEGSDYPIQPKDIDINRVCLVFEGREIKGLLNTFGHAQTEWSAELIIELCQKAGQWLAFTHEELDEAWLKTERGQRAELFDMSCEWVRKSCQERGATYHPFGFYYLDEGGWIVLGPDGKYRITEAFIKRCYEKHPANK